MDLWSFPAITSIHPQHTIHPYRTMHPHHTASIPHHASITSHTSIISHTSWGWDLAPGHDLHQQSRGGRRRSSPRGLFLWRRAGCRPRGQETTDRPTRPAPDTLLAGGEPPSMVQETKGVWNTGVNTVTVWKGGRGASGWHRPLLSHERRGGGAGGILRPGSADPPPHPPQGPFPHGAASLQVPLCRPPTPPPPAVFVRGKGKGKVLGRSPNSSVSVIPTCPSQHPFRLAGSQTP